MDVYFNEVSLTDDVVGSYNCMRDFAEAYRELKNLGEFSCYLSSDSYNSIIGMMLGKPIYRNLLNFVFSFFHTPYEESEKVKSKEDEYLLHNWTVNEKKCFGLALSFLSDSLSISFEQHFWPEKVMLLRDLDEISVRNVSCADHVIFHSEWIRSLKEIFLVESDLNPKEKKISVRDDHGSDILMRFSKKLVNNPYVVSVVNSLEFHPKYRRFVYRVREDGIVELVLWWTDAGYGVAVQTTGRDGRETEAIAEKLREEYEE